MLEFLQYIFIRNAIKVGILASLIFGVIGTLVVVKRIVFISGGVAHASFGGVGLAFYLGWNPLIGASLFAVLSSISIGILKEKATQREDTAIGIIWALGMALGALLYNLTPGYLPSIEGYLFGNILMIGNTDIILLLTLTTGIMIIVPLFYYKLQAVSFDEEFSEVIGVNTQTIYFLLLILIAFSIVFLIKLVGIILVIAMLAIPASLSLRISQDMRKIMAYSSLLSFIFIFSGLWLSYLWDTPAGTTIALTAGCVFIADLILEKITENFLNK